MQETLFVVIPVYNRMAHTLQCLRGLQSQSDKNFRVIVVNDGSTDDTKAEISRQFPWVTLLDTSGERWWTGSTNDGIVLALQEALAGDYILFLNNDLTMGPEYITTLRASAKKHRRQTIVGSVVLLQQDHQTIIDGGTIRQWRERRKLGPLSISFFPSDYVESNVHFLTGRGVLYPIEVFTEFGLLDDVHFKQCGDTEFPIRLKRRGYSLIVDYNCRVYMDSADSFAANVSSEVNFGMWRNFFFDIRSNRNLKYTYYFCRAMSGGSLYFLPHLVYSYCLTVGGFVRAIILSTFRRKAAHCKILK